MSDAISGALERTANALDFRRWPRPVWLILNVAFILAMLGIRFRSELWRVLRTSVGVRRSMTALQDDGPSDAEYEERRKRDKEWAERAKKRLPHY